MDLISSESASCLLESFSWRHPSNAGLKVVRQIALFHAPLLSWLYSSYCRVFFLERKHVYNFFTSSFVCRMIGCLFHEPISEPWVLVAVRNCFPPRRECHQTSNFLLIPRNPFSVRGITPTFMTTWLKQKKTHVEPVIPFNHDAPWVCGAGFGTVSSQEESP